VRRTPSRPTARDVHLPEILLNEFRAHVHIELHEGLIADAREAVHLARLDDENVAGAGLELLTVHDIASAALLDELNLVVGMAMRARTASGLTVEQKGGDPDITLVGADEVVGAPAEGQIFLASAMHVWLCLKW
jgi:hypothetical protein